MTMTKTETETAVINFSEKLHDQILELLIRELAENLNPELRSHTNGLLTVLCSRLCAALLAPMVGSTNNPGQMLDIWQSFVDITKGLVFNEALKYNKFSITEDQIRKELAKMGIKVPTSSV